MKEKEEYWQVGSSALLNSIASNESKKIGLILTVQGWRKQHGSEHTKKSL